MSTGDDAFIGTADYGKLYNATFFSRAKFFDSVVVQGMGGVDTATMYDSAGNDQYLGNKPCSVACQWPNWDHKTYTVEDLAVGHIRFEDDSVMQVEASFAAHVPDRRQEQEIAKQMIETSMVDVMLGGGGSFIDVKAAANGYRTVTTAGELAAIDPEGGRVLGVFSDSHIPYAIDRDGATDTAYPTLAAMTGKAIEILATDPDGFFLVVEGGRIDHGGHLNDVGAVLGQGCHGRVRVALDVDEEPNAMGAVSVGVGHTEGIQGTLRADRIPGLTSEERR